MTLANRTPVVALLLAYALAAGLALRSLAPVVSAPPVSAEVVDSLQTVILNETATQAPTLTATATPTPTATATPTVTPTVTSTPLPVQVLRSYPIDGDSDVLPQAPLRFVFDQPMDTRPEAVSVIITPTLPLEAEWPAADSLLVRAPAWQPRTQYQVTLRVAHSRHGAKLTHPLTVSFRQGERGAPIPILMYHHVDVLGPNPSAGVKEWTVSPDDLAAQLDLLGKMGAHVVPLAEAADYLERGEPLPSRPAVITFDDGNKCLLQNAIPALRSRHLPATFFVPANYADVNHKEFMSWADLKGLAEAGFTLGGHSYNHAFVHNLSPAEAEHQFGDERRRYESMTGAKPQFFSYPFGRYSSKTVEQIRAHDYRGAVTIEQTVYQKPAKLFEMGRIRIGYGEPLERLKAKLPWKE